MKRWVYRGLAALLPVMLVVPVEAGEVVFRGREISLTKSFVCGKKTRPEGRYGLEISWDAAASRATMTVFKGEDNLCEVPGESLTGADMRTQKIRLLTRVNPEKKAIEVSMYVPSGQRGSLQNQVFYLPLAGKN